MPNRSERSPPPPSIALVNARHAPTSTNLYQKPSVSTYEKSVNLTEAELPETRNPEAIKHGPKVHAKLQRKVFPSPPATGVPRYEETPPS